MEKVRERLLRAARALDAAGIAYAVVGGNTVAAHVSRVDEAAVRTTRDVVLLLRRSDLAAAAAALTGVGFTHRRVAGLGMPEGMDASWCDRLSPPLARRLQELLDNPE
ncbi:MAG: hypothetical protein J0L84_00055 [Verrucomicrobia bacterium]|nr:hypothetical protein [Verrucomicrobiota bacterium]